MQTYKRKKSLQLYVLRLLLAGLVTFLIYFIKNGQGDYAFLIGFTVAVVSIFPITTISIDSKSITLTQFYLFGYFPKKLKISKDDNFKIDPAEIQMSDPGGPIDSPDFLSSLTAGSISNTFSYKRYQFKKIRPTGGSERMLVKLSKEEISKLETFFRLSHCL